MGWAAVAWIARRSPRPYVDLSSVPPSEWDMHEMLEHWRRWASNRPGQAVSRMFEAVVSAAAPGRPEYGVQTASPIDREKALAVAKAVAKLPPRHRSALNWHYLKPKKAVAKAKELDVTLEGLACLVCEARVMLRFSLKGLR